MTLKATLPLKYGAFVNLHSEMHLQYPILCIPTTRLSTVYRRLKLLKCVWIGFLIKRKLFNFQKIFKNVTQKVRDSDFIAKSINIYIGYDIEPLYLSLKRWLDSKSLANHDTLESQGAVLEAIIDGSKVNAMDFDVDYFSSTQLHQDLARLSTRRPVGSKEEADRSSVYKIIRDGIFLNALSTRERMRTLVSFMRPEGAQLEAQKLVIAKLFIPPILNLAESLESGSFDRTISKLYNATLKLVNGSADANLPTTAGEEICEICDEDIHMNDISIAKCNSGHVFSMAQFLLTRIS